MDYAKRNSVLTDDQSHGTRYRDRKKPGWRWKVAGSRACRNSLINRILSISTQISQERKSEELQSIVAETQQVLGDYRRTLRKSVLIPASKTA